MLARWPGLRKPSILQAPLVLNNSESDICYIITPMSAVAFSTHLEAIVYDLRFAWRGLRRDRAFTLTAIAMLTLAIALNVTVFAVMDTMLFRGLPLAQRPDRLVYIQERRAAGGGLISYEDFEDWRTETKSFEGLAFVGESGISLKDGDGRPLDTNAFALTVNTFGLLGVRPMLGRDFAPADEVPGAPTVAILNHRFWVSRFGSRADIVGMRVRMNRSPATIIGVMPEGFDFPTKWDLWIPLVQTAELKQRGPTSAAFLAVGRLRDGVSLRQARTELETINRRLETAYPATNRGVFPAMFTHAEANSGSDASMIWGSLWAAAWFVFLIACANLTNLSLARSIGRAREYSTRIALGAGQGRMIRQVLMENLTIAAVAGVAGWWIAKWCVHQWDLATFSMYQVLDYTVDFRTFSYLAAITLGAAILFSLAPVAKVMQIGVNGVLKDDTQGVTQGPRGKRFAAGLIAVQMALAMVLLSGAGVLVRSLVSIVTANTGIRHPEQVLVGSARLPSDKYPSIETRNSYYERLETRLRTIPGIEEATLVSNLPVYSVNQQTFEIEGKPAAPNDREPIGFFAIGSNYFGVVSAAAVSGREFNDGDRQGSLPVALVNQSFAARFLPGENPIGKRLRSTVRNRPNDWLTVVGVVPNIMQDDPVRQRFKPLVYVPLRQRPPARAYFLARTRMTTVLTSAIRAELQKIDSDVSLEELMTLNAHMAFDRNSMDALHSELGKYATVAPIFAVIALVLAAIGLYAVIAHSVGRRSREIGVRMAIGATVEDIRGMILREGMLPVAAGTILGLAASLAVNRVLQSQLVGVSPYDPATIASVPAILAVVALLACGIPARRAVNVDPAIALRHH
jgi:putative ABC transport system permease protein